MIQAILGGLSLLGGLVGGGSGGGGGGGLGGIFGKLLSCLTGKSGGSESSESSGNPLSKLLDLFGSFLPSPSGLSIAKLLGGGGS